MAAFHVLRLSLESAYGLIGISTRQQINPPPLLGSGPGENRRGQSPVEYRRNMTSRPYVRPPKTGPSRSEAGPDLSETGSSLSKTGTGLSEASLGLLEVGSGLSEACSGRQASQRLGEALKGWSRG